MAASMECAKLMVAGVYLRCERQGAVCAQLVDYTYACRMSVDGMEIMMYLRMQKIVCDLYDYRATLEHPRRHRITSQNLYSFAKRCGTSRSGLHKLTSNHLPTHHFPATRPNPCQKVQRCPCQRQATSLQGFSNLTWISSCLVTQFFQPHLHSMLKHKFPAPLKQGGSGRSYRLIAII